MSDFSVTIERGATRRKIILSALIGRQLPGLIGIPEKDFEVSDAEIEDFVNSGLTAEENGWAKRRYHDEYLKNVNDALGRLHPPKTMTVGRAATGFVDFEHNEASSTTPIDPSKK